MGVSCPEGLPFALAGREPTARWGLTVQDPGGARWGHHGGLCPLSPLGADCCWPWVEPVRPRAHAEQELARLGELCAWRWAHFLAVGPLKAGCLGSPGETV